MKNKVYVTVGELAEHLNCPFLGDSDKKIYGIALYHESNENTLTYIPSDKIDIIPEVNASAILTQSSMGYNYTEIILSQDIILIFYLKTQLIL